MDTRKIVVIKRSPCANIEHDKSARLQRQEERRQAELKKIRNELLTLARRVEAQIDPNS